MKQRIKRFFRVVAGHDWYPGIDIRVPIRTLGNRNASWTFASEFINQNSVVYCVGIGQDISFDLALHAEYNLAIHAFDPTPKSLAWVKTQSLPNDFFVHEFGLSDRDDVVQFSPPDNPDFVSHRILQRLEVSGAAVACPVKRFESIKKDLGHGVVDLMKIDIEGAEYSVVRDFVTSNSYPKQLLVEFHHRHPGHSIAETREAVGTLRRIGFKLFHVSSNGEEYAFLHSTADRSVAVN